MIPDGFDFRAPDYAPVWQERMRRLATLRGSPELVPGLKQFYIEHPVEFINDWMTTYDPRLVERGIEATVPFLLFPRQQEFVRWVVERWKGREDGLGEKSRDMGVSWLCVGVSVWMWLFHKGVAIGFGSRKEAYVDDLANPNSLFWKIRMAVDLLPPELRPLGWDVKKHAPYMRIVNPENGSVILGEAGDNIGRGGRTSIYFVDEAAFLERADTVEAALSQTSNCRLWISTPNGSGNVFYRKRHGGRIPVFVFDWRQDPRKDQAWYEDQCNKLDPVVVAQEIDRNYESSVANSLISGEIVREAAARGPAAVRPVGGLRVGVDVARFGDDKTVITFRKGRVLLRQTVLEKLDVVQVAGHVREEVRAYQEMPEQIAVDTIGIGAGVADILRGWYGTAVVDVNSADRMSDGRHYNRRAFMWVEMREWLKAGSIPQDEALKTELTSLRYTFKSGELLLESKDDAKKRGVKSPDRADSLALTFAHPTLSMSEVVNHEMFAPQFDSVAGY